MNCRNPRNQAGPTPPTMNAICPMTAPGSSAKVVEVNVRPPATLKCTKIAPSENTRMACGIDGTITEVDPASALRGDPAVDLGLEDFEWHRSVLQHFIVEGG